MLFYAYGAVAAKCSELPRASTRLARCRDALTVPETWVLFAIDEHARLLIDRSATLNYFEQLFEGFTPWIRTYHHGEQNLSCPWPVSMRISSSTTLSHQDQRAFTLSLVPSSEVTHSEE